MISEFQSTPSKHDIARHRLVDLVRIILLVGNRYVFNVKIMIELKLSQYCCG